MHDRREVIHILLQEPEFATATKQFKSTKDYKVFEEYIHAHQLGYYCEPIHTLQRYALVIGENDSDGTSRADETQGV